MTEPSKAAFAKADELYDRELRESPYRSAVELSRRALARVLDEHHKVAKWAIEQLMPIRAGNVYDVSVSLASLTLPDEPDRLAKAWKAAHNDCGAFINELRKQGGRIVWDDEG